MPIFWKKLAIGALVCGACSIMAGTTEAAIAPVNDFSLTMPGQIQHYDLTVGIEDFAMEEKLSPAERRRLERERWERERRRREMERRRRHHRPPPPPPRRRHYPPPRRHWSADVGQTANMFQLPNGTIAALTE